MTETWQLPQSAATVLWLSGWSFDDAVFAALRGHLPEWRHIAVRYEHAGSPEQFFALASAAAEASRRSTAGPLLLAGWSLGSLLALRLAADGLADGGLAADGRSDGGLAAGGLAADELLAGDRIAADGIVLLSGTARFVRPKGETSLGWPDAYVRQMSAAIKQDRRAVELKFRGLLLTPRELENGFARKLPPAGSWSTEALQAGLSLLRNEDCRDLLPAITVPALLIHGAEDAVCPVGAAVEICGKLPRAKLVVLDACGHAPCLTRHQETADAIRSWWHEQQAANDTAAI